MTDTSNREDEASKSLYLNRIDNVAPVIEIQSIQAIELDRDNQETGNNLITGNNNSFTLNTAHGIQHAANFKITAKITDASTLRSGFPSISPVIDWQGPSKSGSIYTWTKKITGLDYDIGQRTLAYTITARDSAASNNTSSANVAAVLTINDNTNPTISEFTVSGYTEVNGTKSITLVENGPNITISATLKTSDNGAIKPHPKLKISSDGGLTFSDTSHSNFSAGSYNYQYVFRYQDFDLSEKRTLSFFTIVEDNNGNQTQSNSEVVDLIQIDQNPPVLSFELYASKTSPVDTTEANKVTDTANSFNIYSSERQGQNSDVGYFIKAVLQASDPRGIAQLTLDPINANGSPEIELVEQESGTFTGFIGYDRLPNYGTSHTYTMRASARDTQDNVVTRDKIFAIKKLDNVNPKATFISVTGLVENGTKKIMSSAVNNDNMITVEIEVNENSGILLTGNGVPKPVMQGPGATFERVSFSGGGVQGGNGRQRFNIYLDKADYKYTNIADGVYHDQGSLLTSESITFTMTDHAGNDETLIDFPIVFDIEHNDEGKPISDSLTFSDNNTGIQEGTSNVFQSYST